MKVEDVRRLPARERLLYWVRERHQIYLRRLCGMPKPWTDDEVLQSCFFTNPYRENDKVTVWYRKNIREPLNESAEVLFATIAFRWFNWPATGELLINYAKLPQTTRLGLLQFWDTEAAVELLSSQEGKVFTGAFTISPSGSTKPKINRACEDYIGPAWKLRHVLLREFLELKTKGCTLARACNILQQLPGFKSGTFMPAQVVADLKYTHLLDSAKDWWTWCAPGPGSIKGLNLALGMPVDRGEHPNFLGEVAKLRMWLNAKLHNMPPLHSQDVQNCLCEFSKYERALNSGHVKRRYPGV